MAVVIDGTADTITARTNSAVTATIALDAIGTGQSWVNFATGRSSGVTYTNSTGESIMVSVQVIGGATITVGGVVAASSGVNDAQNHLHAVVPNGSTYIAAGSIGRWSELRG